MVSYSPPLNPVHTASEMFSSPNPALCSTCYAGRHLTKGFASHVSDGFMSHSPPSKLIVKAY